jgi:hypothetical protein
MTMRSYGYDHVGLPHNQFLGSFLYALEIGARPANFNVSVATLGQPSSCKLCTNDLKRACPYGSLSEYPISTATRRAPPGCSAPAANEKATTPPRNPKKDRRLILALSLGRDILT